VACSAFTAVGARGEASSEVASRIPTVAAHEWNFQTKKVVVFIGPNSHRNDRFNTKALIVRKLIPYTAERRTPKSLRLNS
jgi:hypothetical protein